MGFNARYGHLPKTPPAWMANVGAMKRAGAVVAASCGNPRCRYSKAQIDFDQIIAAKGEDYSLWDRRPPCPVCREGRIVFLYAGGAHTPLRPARS